MTSNRIRIGLLVAIFVISATTAARANLCDASALRAAEQTDVPIDVMRTITRLETGRGASRDPWPWTVNTGGDGSWFPTEDDARSYVFSKVKSGLTNIDIGCFQINYHWHSEGFQSLDAMFDPELNALYAARFLSELYREFGNWTDAAGAYHSRTPEFAERYKAKFRDLHIRVADLDLPIASQDMRQARALFEQGGKPRSGSVFQIGTSSPAPFIQFDRTN